jgi:hypothetical protein
MVSRWEANEVARWIGGYWKNSTKIVGINFFVFVKVLLVLKMI